ncbi:MAG: hypothetical protein ABI402_04955 [Ferruginibacter sp.]
MKKIIITCLSASFFILSCVKDRDFPALDTIYKQPGAPVLDTRTAIHYWNFNNVPTLLSATSTIGGASLVYQGAAYDDVQPGTTLNARNGDIDGSGLRLRNPAGDFILSLPTINYKDIVFSFALQRSSSGAQQNTISYTIDGVNFITDSLQPHMLKPDTLWNQYYFDFSSIKRANDNPNFKIKIEFAINTDGTSGNDRYDNITVDGNIINTVVALPEILHYWNFNDPTDINTLTTATNTLGGGSIAYIGTWDAYATGSDINIRNGDPAGGALRLRNPAGTFTITAPTTDHKNIVLTMAVQRSSSGAQTNTLTYSIDGINFISTGIASNTYTPGLDPDYVLITYYFAGIAGIDNNPNFKINIDFSNGSTGTSGNNRFDNLVIEGVHI